MNKVPVKNYLLVSGTIFGLMSLAHLYRVIYGLGFPPFQAATVCLLANTAPVAWGGVGNPIRVLNGVTGLPTHELNAMVGRILPPFSLILPLWLVRSMVGWRETLEVLPALLVSGASFAAMQFYWSNYQETGLVDIVAAIFSLLVMVAFLRVWKPRTVLEVGASARTMEVRTHGVGAVLKGWSPFILASVLIFVYALPSVNRYLKIGALTFPTPSLHAAVIRVPPVVEVPTPETASIDLNALALPGTAVFLGAFLAAPLSGCASRARYGSWGRPSASSCHRCWPSASWWASPTSPGIRAWTPSSACRSLTRAGSTRSSGLFWAGWGWRSPAPTQARTRSSETSRR